MRPFVTTIGSAGAGLILGTVLGLSLAPAGPRAERLEDLAGQTQAPSAGLATSRRDLVQGLAAPDVRAAPGTGSDKELCVLLGEIRDELRKLREELPKVGLPGPSSVTEDPAGTLPAAHKAGVVTDPVEVEIRRAEATRLAEEVARTRHFAKTQLAYYRRQRDQVASEERHNYERVVTALEEAVAALIDVKTIEELVAWGEKNSSARPPPAWGR